MATIVVNGTSLPEPSAKKRLFARLGQDNRTATGAMSSQYIAQKRTYDITWATMSPSQLTALQTLLKPTLAPGTMDTGMHFSMTIIDAADGGSYTGTFYAGDINSETRLIITGVEVVINIKILIIEV